jgi:hypothetical protein
MVTLVRDVGPPGTPQAGESVPHKNAAETDKLEQPRILTTRIPE